MKTLWKEWDGKQHARADFPRFSAYIETAYMPESKHQYTKVTLVTPIFASRRIACFPTNTEARQRCERNGGNRDRN